MKEEIGLDDYTRMEELKDLARKTMADPNETNQYWIEQAVDAICDTK